MALDSRESRGCMAGVITHGEIDPVPHGPDRFLLADSHLAEALTSFLQALAAFYTYQTNAICGLFFCSCH